jgi:uncharacterized protein
MTKPLFDTADDGLVLRVHVQPGAGREAVVGIHGDALKVRVVAPPVSGRANTALLSLLARSLGVDGKALEITSGETARAKRVKVTGLEPEELEARLRRLVDESRPEHGPGGRGERRF